MWRILDRIFELGLKFESSETAVRQRKEFLLDRKIGICDIVASAERVKMDATDLGMQNIVLRDLIGVLYKCPSVDTLLFTGGNSKNGPEYFFRRHIKEYGLDLVRISDEIPRIHSLELPLKYANRNSGLNRYAAKTSAAGERIIRTVSLTAPSGSANRAVGSMEKYKRIKDRSPEYTTFDFRVDQYRPYF